MNKKFKKLLIENMEYPNPLKKDRFIRKYRLLSHEGAVANSHGNDSLAMLKAQASYISKPVWALSFIVLIIGAAGLSTYKLSTAMFISALMPFVSAVAVIEAYRSEIYSVSELEGATKFSLRGIFFTRFACIGLSHIALIFILMLIIGRNAAYGYLMTGALITIPYLLSSVLNMELERTAFGRKNPFACLLVSAITAFISVYLQGIGWGLYAEFYPLWYLAAFMLILAEYREIKKTLDWEEYVWN